MGFLYLPKKGIIHQWRNELRPRKEERGRKVFFFFFSWSLLNIIEESKIKIKNPKRQENNSEREEINSNKE